MPKFSCVMTTRWRRSLVRKQQNFTSLYQHNEVILRNNKHMRKSRDAHIYLHSDFSSGITNNVF